MKQRHIARLRTGRCSMEAGLVLEDIITDHERVSDHCSNVAVCLIETAHDEFGTHKYTAVKGEAPWFAEEYKKCRRHYTLPVQNG